MATKQRAAVHYQITPVDPAAHLFEVRMSISRPSNTRAAGGALPEGGQRVYLPAWIPGSYLIRDFARHIVSITASVGRTPAAVTKLDKDSWLVAPIAESAPGSSKRNASGTLTLPSGTLTLLYRVYAWDLSVRGAHLDQTHGFFNGTSVFLCADGFESDPCTIDIARPTGRAYAQWRVATSLPLNGARLWGFGQYRAANYDELIDHPVEMGTFRNHGFNAGGARHEIVVSGEHDTDFGRLSEDLKKICDAQLRLFDPRRGKAPIARYLFLTQAVGDGYGGLEHRASTALICSRKDLPYPGMDGAPAGYQTFLGLCSHEYFHTWHVKRIKPAAFAPYRLNEESYTRLLWVFEGFTAYYDDLMLLRAGTISAEDYLKLLSQTITNVLRGEGRLMQSVAESSFDAWTRFYKQDENAPNAIVSYYTKGSLVALALDLSIRLKTGHARSLDDVMRLLWQRYGRQFEAQGRGVAEDDMPSLIEQATGLKLAAQIKRWAHGTEDLPLARLLKPFGIDLKHVAAGPQPVWLGARIAASAGECRLAQVYHLGPAHKAGLSAGDILVSVDRMRVTSESELTALLARRETGQSVDVAVFRGDVLHTFALPIEPPPTNAVQLEASKAGKRRLARLSESR